MMVSSITSSQRLPENRVLYFVDSFDNRRTVHAPAGVAHSKAALLHANRIFVLAPQNIRVLCSQKPKCKMRVVDCLSQISEAT